MSPAHGPPGEDAAHAGAGVEADASGDEACTAMRQVLDRVGERWSLMAVVALRDGPVRFNRLRRALEGVSQRMLTLTLRRLVRDGLVSRVVLPGVPPQVEYALTPLGESLRVQVQGLLDWSVLHRQEMDESRQRFDAAQAPRPR